MFYSHEVLTSRKYGVATVWLVATLGSVSNSKRLTRKAIQDVDVPKACHTIVDPVAPMALRLQGNLLYGVSRVHLQQCTYVLSDAQNAYNSMHMMLRAIENAALDPQAGKARPEHLILPDDPSFLPEFAMPPLELLAELELGPDLPPLHLSGDSQSLTPFADRIVPSTPVPVGGLILPTSSPVDPGGFVLPGHRSSSVEGLADENVLDAPDFMFDEDGEFVDLTPTNLIHGTPAALRGSNMHNNVTASSKVRQEHDEGLHRNLEVLVDQMDLDFPIIGDDLPEGEAFPTGPNDQQDVPTEVVELSDTASAPNLRKKRTARVLPTDTTNELRNKDLADWNANYLVNMKEAFKVKDQYRRGQVAKKNAEYWYRNSGIGGVASRFQGITGPTPLDRFIGELVTGVSGNAEARSKRDRDSGIDEATQEESRRVRQKTDELEEEAARGQEDEGIFAPGDDEIELPRDEQTALDDHRRFSEMPWNITASIRGSSVVPRSGRIGLVGSAPPSSVAGRGRLISESPLLRRSQPGGLDDLQLPGENGLDFMNLGEDDFVGFAGPGISSDMPEVALAPPNPAVQGALSAEGGNFLAFVADAVATTDETSLDEMLPPDENNNVVAAQAFMMILTLGTRSLLDVRQDEHFGDINISLTERGRITGVGMPLQEEDQDHIAEDETVQEAGHFEEHFTAGREEVEGEEEED